MTDTFLDLDEVIDAAPDNLAPAGVVWPAGYTLNSKGLWFAKDSESAPHPTLRTLHGHRSGA